MTSIEGKKIILIIPKFFGYEKLIVHELKTEGAQVTVVYENLDEINYVYRFFYAYLPKVKNIIFYNYYHHHLGKVLKSTDAIIVIRGSSLDEKIMNYIVNNAPIGCKYYLYQWDSVKNNPSILSIQDMFNKVSTFDPEDALQYNWNYRPLFFVPDLLHKHKKENDILFIASLHTKRVEIFNNIKKICKNQCLSSKLFLYSKKIIYYKKKYLDKKAEYDNASNKDIIFKPLTITQSYHLYAESKTVIDYTHPQQKGLTMRTIECVGNNCKLITNNKFIAQTELFDPCNIYIYDEDNFEIPNWFINTEYKAIPSNIVNKYSIKQWLKDIMI